MKCPFCACSESKVIDSRPTDEGERIRRRRECIACGKRFTTYEIIETVPVIVVKKNQNLHLPHALNGLEKTMRAMEDGAQAVTEQLLNTESWAMMLMTVLLVGVLTGMGEEAFFRAGMLGSMRHGGVNRHVAVWTAAIVFSAIHLQFYGFVPRMLLGAWFGYVMLWSGEVWTPIIAHALNNSAVVVCTFLAHNKYISGNFLETLGVPQQGEKPFLAIASAIATALVIWAFMRNKGEREEVRGKR